jgi:hypothetical protein
MSTQLQLNKTDVLRLLKPSTSELVTIIDSDDPVRLGVYEAELTIEKALNGTGLRILGKTIGVSNLTTIIVFLINRLSSNFNVGRKFTPEQAVVMAIDLIDVFGFETLEDVMLLFKMARTGRIGDGRDFKLDSQTVFHKWIPEYLELKVDLRERLHNREKQLIKETDLTIEDVKKAYEKAKSTPQKREDALNAQIDELTEGFNREQLEALIVKWEADLSKKKIIRYLYKKRLTIKE